MKEQVDLSERFGDPVFGDVTKYIHVSRAVWKVPVYGDPANPDNITRINTFVQNKGLTRTDELERHLRKQNPKVFFNRGEKLPLRKYITNFRLGQMRSTFGSFMARRREEALSA